MKACSNNYADSAHVEEYYKCDYW